MPGAACREDDPDLGLLGGVADREGRDRPPAHDAARPHRYEPARVDSEQGRRPGERRHREVLRPHENRDLGDFNVASSDPASAWGPGRVPTSGRLPSTAAKPPWWDDAPVEGPAIREARSEWNCCDADAAKHTTRVTAYPPPPDRCEVKDWF